MPVKPARPLDEKILCALARRDARLVADSNGGFRLVARNEKERTFAGDLIAALMGRGLIANGRRGLVLSAAGRNQVRRILSRLDVLDSERSRPIVELREGADGFAARLSVNPDESPLASLRRRTGRNGRPLLDAAGFAAGERLRSDYTRGCLMPRVTANWDAAVAGGRRQEALGIVELTDAAMAARRRVERALLATGPDLGGVLIDVCCFLKGLEVVERERGWPARSAKVVLKLALATLARHYGLAGEARGAARGNAVLHWGTDDYRPTIT